jgi:hypothetical protein
MRSMGTNQVWELEEIPKETKTIRHKWTYKIKHYSQSKKLHIGGTTSESLDQL